MSEIEIVTFGCRLNAYESEVIRARAAEAGVDNAVIVNTCAVTAEAVRQSRQAIRKLKRARPNATLIVTGCAAQIEPDTYAAMPEVDRVLGNEEKLSAASYTPDFLKDAPRVVVNDIMAVKETAGQLLDSLTAASFESRARAVLQVQNGCDHRCTFCIIPYARGPSRSVPVATIIAHARKLVANGAREIVLTGVDLTAYGADLPEGPSLGSLARCLLAEVPELPRLRLSSLDPSEIDDELWALFAEEPRLMPHLHLSLQAGDDLILKRMKRRHSRAQVLDVVRRARALRPDVAIGADLIAGFPTEDEAMFRNSLDLVAECGIAFLHVFPYSPRPGTPAARMPAVAPEIVRERAARLRAAGAAALAVELGSRIGKIGEVLIEKPGLGRADFYAAVECPIGLAGIQSLRFAGVADGRLSGEPVA
jgi:threonylcarbamoyladenosine tRNA methylthiotransferase MtaB